MSDGLLKRKRKRLPRPRASNDLENARSLVKAFIRDPSLHVENVDQHQRAVPLDIVDGKRELTPEVYLTQPEPAEDEIRSGLQDSIRNTFAYLVKINRANMMPSDAGTALTTSLPTGFPTWRHFVAEDIFDIHRGHFHSIADLDPGSYITISRISEDNGFVGFYDIPRGAAVWPAGTITVSTVTGDTFAQPVPFIATDNVVMLTPKSEFNGFSPPSLMFAAHMLNRVRWRFSYGRQCYQGRFSKTEFTLPVTPDGSLDYEYMTRLVEGVSYWPYVKHAFEG